MWRRRRVRCIKNNNLFYFNDFSFSFIRVCMNDNVRKSVYSKWKRVFCVSCVFHRAHMAFPNFLSLQQEVRKAAGSLGANFFVSQGESLAADVSNDAQPDAARTSKLTLLFLYRPAVLCVVLCEHSLT